MWNQSYGKHDLESAQTPLYPMMMESPELRASNGLSSESLFHHLHPASSSPPSPSLPPSLKFILFPSSSLPLIVMCPLYYPVNYLLLLYQRKSHPRACDFDACCGALYTFWPAKRGHDFNSLGPFLFGFYSI